MRYSVGLALSRVKRNVKPYSFIVFQLFIGFLVLCTAFNADFSMRERLEELRREIKASEIRADIQNSSVANGNFGFETYEKLKQASSCPTGLVTTAMIAAVCGGNPETVAVVCAPERYMEERFSAGIAEDAVLCTKKLYDTIREGRLRLYGNTEIFLSGDSVTVNGQDFALSVLNPPDGISCLRRDENPEHDLSLDTVLFFPEDAGKEWEKEEFVSFQAYLYPADQDEYAAAYGNLYRNLPDVLFSIYDPAAFLVKSCQSLSDGIRLLTLVSGTLLAITGIGTVGILLIALYRRKEETAVAAAVGAPMGRIRLEYFIEVFLVCLAGIAAGAVGAVFSTKLIAASEQFVRIRYVGKTLWIALASCCCLPALVTGLALAGFGRFDVSAFLRGEE